VRRSTSTRSPTTSPRAQGHDRAAARRRHGLRRQRTGEAREADLGVASGNGKGQIFVKGEVIKTVPEAEIVATLIEEANRIADEMGPDAPLGTAQVVTA
jgi:hypothetical protein